jgi:methylmalonyl-CoA/ethylmalonyl-CoA epimerase
MSESPTPDPLAGELPLQLRPHHLGIAVASIEEAQPLYERLFGLRVTSGPFDDPIQKVRVCFLAATETERPVLELVAPGKDGSPVNSYLSRGIGAYHLCYEVADLQRCLERARANRCVVLGEPVPAVAFGGRRIAWIYTPTRHLIELLEATAPV